jgi:hypothetical protein
MNGGPTAAQRLMQSRARLQAALQHAPNQNGPSTLELLLAWATAAGARASGSPGEPGSPARVPPWLLDALARWWAPHPLHQVLVLLRAMAEAWARPVAARHPMALLGGALLGGAALVRVRPWRWLAPPALLAGLAPALWRAWVRRPAR